MNTASADLRGIRSVLFCPGHRLDHLSEAGSAAADLLVLDLEDTVPAAAKPDARRSVRDYVQALASRERSRVFLRPNLGALGFDGDELEIASLLSGLIVPKVESPSDLAAAADGLMRAGKGSDDRGTGRLIATLETIRGVLHAADILSFRGDVAGVIFGPSDLTLELGVRGLPDHSELAYPRSHVALCAAADEVIAIDGGFALADDLEGLVRDAETASRMGYRAKLTTIPGHVPIINSVMGPRDEDLAWANETLGQAAADPVSLAKARSLIDRSTAIHAWSSGS